MNSGAILYHQKLLKMNATELDQILKIFKRRNIAAGIVIMLISLIYIPVNAQSEESPASHIKVTADLVSHYVWRGSMATGSPTPNFQPTLAYTSKMLEVGVWGSTDFVGDYKEFDPYI